MESCCVWANTRFAPTFAPLTHNFQTIPRTSPMSPDPLLSPRTAPLLTLEARFRGVPLTVRLHESAGIFWATRFGQSPLFGRF